MNWRSLVNQGAITEKWNSPATPVYYVIDPDGVIRYKWVGDPGEKAIGAVLEQLIQAAGRTRRMRRSGVAGPVICRDGYHRNWRRPGPSVKEAQTLAITRIVR